MTCHPLGLRRRGFLVDLSRNRLAWNLGLPLLGICIKLSIDSFRQDDGFVLFPQTIL